MTKSNTKTIELFNTIIFLYFENIFNIDEIMDIFNIPEEYKKIILDSLDESNWDLDKKDLYTHFLKFTKKYFINNQEVTIFSLSNEFLNEMWTNKMILKIHDWSKISLEWEWIFFTAKILLDTDTYIPNNDIKDSFYRGAGYYFAKKSWYLDNNKKNNRKKIYFGIIITIIIIVIYILM